MFLVKEALLPRHRRRELVRVEHYRRERDGAWRYRVLGAGDVVALGNGAVVGIDGVYEGAFELGGD